MFAPSDPSQLAPLDLVGLTRLMQLTQGEAWVRIGLADGPIDHNHPHLNMSNVRVLGPATRQQVNANSAGVRHATFLAGILHGVRGGPAPAIAPGCPLLAWPIFTSDAAAPSSAASGLLAEALVELVRGGARIINVSAALVNSSGSRSRHIEAALDHTANNGVLVIAASGNRAMLSGTALTRHPWVVPVVACDRSGVLAGYSNISRSAGCRGVRAPGEGIVSLAPGGMTTIITGTSVAASLVTGAAALAWSLHLAAGPAMVRAAICGWEVVRRSGLVPPLLDAWKAHLFLSRHNSGVLL
jgi:subtilisin family serine protease